jgi:hypothetical protein
MNCQEFHQNISLYLDDALAAEFRVACDEHLDSCPLCRAELSEMRGLTLMLSQTTKLSVPIDLAQTISRSVAIELAAQQEINQPKIKISPWQTIWEKHLQPQFVPYATGVFASLLLFTMMFATLVNSLAAFREMQAQSRRERLERSVLLAETTNLPYEQLASFPAADYAVRRLSVTSDSPSLNPQSAFVTLTSSLTRGEAKNDAIMVVADVLSNGVANIADVIQSPREPGKLAELDKLLREDPAFVPASLDHRPENVRIVLLIQKVEVRVIQRVEVREADQLAQLRTRKSRKF